MTDIHQPSDLLRRQIVQQADLCVMCGMCSTQCPTYQLSRDENDSPRGRIALLRGLATDQIALNGKTLAHLDQCLLCRSCEKKCPSGVAYGSIMDNGRALIHAGNSHNRATETGLYLTGHKSALLYIRRLLRLIQLLRLDVLAEKMGITRALGLKRAAKLLPRLTRLKALPHKTAGKRESVQLFTGCISDAVDRETIHACIDILDSWGIDASAPKQQTCCGALAQHQGDVRQAESQQDQNRHAFSGEAPILFFATGCGASLLEDKTMAARFREACAYIDSLSQKNTLNLKPLDKRVAVHQPCSLRNVVGDGDAVNRLLSRIPKISLIDTHPGAPNCCGAGGTAMLKYPEIGDPLREQSLEALLDSRPDILVTTNIGCALHLAAGLRERGLDIKVLHPLVLFARQLEKST